MSKVLAPNVNTNISFYNKEYELTKSSNIVLQENNDSIYDDICLKYWFNDTNEFGCTNIADVVTERMFSMLIAKQMQRELDNPRIKTKDIESYLFAYDSKHGFDNYIYYKTCDNLYVIELPIICMHHYMIKEHIEEYSKHDNALYEMIINRYTRIEKMKLDDNLTSYHVVMRNPMISLKVNNAYRLAR